MILVFLLIFIQLVSSQSFSPNNFTAIAPYSIRRGRPFNVVVKGFNLKDTVNVTVLISGISDAGIELRLKKSTVISEQRPKVLIQFVTFNITQGSYNLTISTDDYSDVKPLTYSTNSYAFLVQTDKTLYFPNDLLRFRVFSINSETRSINPRRLTTVIIRDGSGSVVSNVSDVQFVKGRYQNEFQLASSPALGFWKIEVQSGNDTAEKYIEVAEYNIPLIYAGLSIPSKIPISAGIVPITINAKYTFEDIVVGNATVIFERFGTEYFRAQISLDNNVGYKEIELINDLKAAETEIFSYNVTLEYNDKLTNTTLTDFASFETLPKAYSIVLSGDPYLKPGSDFNFFIAVVKYDGSPGPAGMTIDIKVESLDVSKTLELDDSGSVSFSFGVPIETDSILIKATSDYATEASLNVNLALPLLGTVDDTKRTTMRVDVITRDPALNSPVEVELTLDETVEVVTCIIVAKGILLESIEVPITFDDTQTFQTAIFSFTPTIAYAPVASIIAYFVTDDERVVTASTSVELTKDLRNYLTLSPSSSSQPGEDIWVDVESYVNSTVSLVAVDQSIEALRTGNGLIKSEIFRNVLKFYSSAPSRDTIKPPDYEYRLNYYGLLIFTNIEPDPTSYDYTRRLLLNQLNGSSKLNQTASTAPSGSPRSIKTPKPYGRSIFWQNIDVVQKVPDDTTGQRGLARISEIASPDLASYIIYGITLSPYKGIGVSYTNPSISILKPFTISANFPYSIKVSEVLVQGITIFSFLDETQDIEVSINKDPKYEIDLTSSPNWLDSGDLYTRIVTAEASAPQRIQFVMKAVAVGTINFRIQARRQLASDTIDRVLRINPIGVYRSSTDSRLLKVGTSQHEYLGSLSCSIPSSVLEIISSKVSYSGDIMTRPITNLPIRLITLPYGCGEQNMLHTNMDLIAWSYLQQTNQLTPELQSQLYNDITEGISIQNNYQKGSDGAFRTWTDTPQGSTWLTAYSGWGYYMAKDYVSIDMSSIKRGLAYLSAQQRDDGSFIEKSPLIYYRFQSASAEITLAAYVTIYITRVLQEFPEYTDMQQRAVTYLENNWHSRTDVYGLAIIAYALKLAGSPKADNIMNFFYMSRTETATEIYYDSVETTAYCLLLLLVRSERLADAEKIANYLVRISNEFGGYFESQDTVMSIYALSKYALIPQPAGSAELVITPNVGDKVQASYNSTFGLHTVSLNKMASSVGVGINGATGGNLVVSLTCAFYEQMNSFEPAFRIVYSFTYACKSLIKLKLLLNFIPAGQSTGMSIATVTFPSGFVFSKLYIGNDVRKTETANNGQVVTFYFDSMSNNQTTVGFEALRSSLVEGAKLEGYIEVLDYYNPANEASSTFVLPNLPNFCGTVSKK